jgi:hypothetical protein
MNDDLLGYAFVIAVFIIPALGITARFAVKPVVDAIVRLKESFGEAPVGGLVERRVLELEEELRQVQEELRRLSEAEAFQRSLISGAPQPQERVSDTLAHPS